MGSALNAVCKSWDWLTLADYRTAKEKATTKIIARYGRGNVAFQNGYVINRSALKKLAEAGDDAVARLDKLSSQ